MTQGPPERSAALGGVQACRVEMHGRTTTATPVIGIGDDGEGATVLGHDHSQQNGPEIAFPASHAGSHRPHWGPGSERGSGEPVTGRCQSSAPPTVGMTRPPVGTRARAHRAGEGWTSGRMSIRQPVSLAASRAFWPSLPMARDSW